MTSDIIAKLEAATEDEQHVCLYAVAKHARDKGWITQIQCLRMEDLIEVGAFLDAALTLVPEKGLWSVCSMEDGPFAQVIRPMPSGGFEGGLTQGSAFTPALALCIAALKAQEQEMEYKEWISKGKGWSHD